MAYDLRALADAVLSRRDKASTIARPGCPAVPLLGSGTAGQEPKTRSPLRVSVVPHAHHEHISAKQKRTSGLGLSQLVTAVVPEAGQRGTASVTPPPSELVERLALALTVEAEQAQWAASAIAHARSTK